MQNPIIEKNYDEAKRNAKKLYNSIGRVWCPALGEHVIFNSAGFRHLTRQGGTARRKKEQMRRFALLPRVPNIISSFNGNKEYREVEQIATIDRHGEKITTKVLVRFWGLAQKIDGEQIKVIVRQAGNGQKHFFSVF
jgi:hypothetical protein